MQAPASPFSLNDTLSSAWETFKANMSDYVLAQFVLLVPYFVANGALTLSGRRGLAIISILLPAILWTCSMSIAVAGVRKGKPKIDDAFRPLAERQGDYLMVCLAMSAGILACGIGMAVSWVLCIFAALLALDGRDFKQAVIESKDIVLKYPGDVALLAIVTWALNLAGGVLCGIGLLFTMPVTCLMVIRAYEQLSTKLALQAPVEPPPPAEPPPAQV